MRAFGSAGLVLIGLVAGSRAVAERPFLPAAPLHDRVVLDERPTLRFISVTPEMSAGASRPGVFHFSIAPDAAMRLSRLAGTPWGEIALYRRAPTVGESEVAPEAAWDIQFTAQLSPRNVKGNVMFLIYDRDDPTAPQRKAFVTLWDATMDPFRVVAARMSLNPKNEGYHATHTYLLRLVQIWNKREVILAQGTFRLE